jgi:hypothetical protein
MYNDSDLNPYLYGGSVTRLARAGVRITALNAARHLTLR